MIFTIGSPGPIAEVMVPRAAFGEVTGNLKTREDSLERAKVGVQHHPNSHFQELLDKYDR